MKSRAASPRRTCSSTPPPACRRRRGECAVVEDSRFGVAAARPPGCRLLATPRRRPPRASRARTLFSRRWGTSGAHLRFRVRTAAYHPLVSVRPCFPVELEAAVSVWRAANVARGAPHGAERTARIRGKLSAADALAFVALGPEIVGMALAEPGRFDEGGASSIQPFCISRWSSCILPRRKRGSAAPLSSMCLTQPARWATSGRVSGPQR